MLVLNQSHFYTKGRHIKTWFINRSFTNIRASSLATVYSPPKWSNNLSVVCVLMLSSQQMKAQSGLILTAILNPLRDLRGPVFCILNMLTAPSAHTVAMATTDHLWLLVHLSANTPSYTHTHTNTLPSCFFEAWLCVSVSARNFFHLSYKKVNICQVGLLKKYCAWQIV